MNASMYDEIELEYPCDLDDMQIRPEYDPDDEGDES